MRHALGVLGVLAAGVLLAVSAAMNWRFGLSLGKTELDGQIYGAASAAADCFKALIPFFLFAAIRNKMWSQAAAGAVVWVVVTAYSAKPDKWNYPHYPYNISGVRRPYPVPSFPGPNVPPLNPTRPPRQTNPGLPGNPTDWSCAPAPSDGGQTVEFCTTIEEFCDPNGNCVYRLVTCVFDPGPLGNPPNRDGTPPNPGVDYPQWPDPISDLDGKPTGNNENNCIERYYY